MKRFILDLLETILFTIMVFAFLVAMFVRADASEIERIIRTTAQEEGVDPELAVAIAKVESGLNNKKIGKLGEVGVYQLRPEYHRVVDGDVHSNVRTAIRYLRSLQVICKPKYGQAWFVCYNVGPNYAKPIRYPQKFPYYVQVMKRVRQPDCDHYRITIQQQNEIIGRQAEEIERLKFQLTGGSL